MKNQYRLVKRPLFHRNILWVENKIEFGKSVP